MCGIAGLLAYDGGRPPAVEQVQAMVDRLHHRGPDESGIYVDDAVALGHARLSIVDLAGGLQPIHNEDETLWIVYNGEIYNHAELRGVLLARGHQFYTATDTEVVLHMYEEQGSDCVQAFNGQFAFAIWDVRHRRLVLARDRMGIRPLHYTRQNGRFRFASEIKALQQGSPDLDPIALDQIFTFWSPLPGRTAHRGIEELPPGHVAEVGYLGDMRITRYWTVPFRSAELQTQAGVEDVVAQTRAHLEDAVRVRLRADVPVGCYLSGGLDSSGIAAITEQCFDHQLHTFGVRFEDDAFDEGEYQEEMVGWLGTDHVTQHAANEDIGLALADVMGHVETPLLRTGAVPLYLLSRTVRDHGYKVVLTGEGADEVFAGYNIFREAKVRAFWARQPQSSWRPRLLGRLYPYILDDPRLRGMLTSFFGKGLEHPAHPLFSHLVRWSQTSRLKTFFSENLRERIGGYDGVAELTERLPPDFGDRDVLARAQYLEMGLLLGQYLLSSQGDRVAMAHSVEIRLPFLDHRLMEYLATVPGRLKMPGLNEKALLKRVLSPRLPPRITKRSKHPYRAPIAGSLLRGAARERVLGFVSDRALADAGLFDAAKVRRLLRKLEAEPASGEFESMALSGIVTTQMLMDSKPWPVPTGVRPAVVFDRRIDQSTRARH